MGNTKSKSAPKKESAAAKKKRLAADAEVKAYNKEIQDIMKGKSVDEKTAKEIYKANKEKAERLAKKDSKPKAKNGTGSNSASKKAISVAKMKEVVSGLNARRLPKAEMLKYVDKTVGRKCKIHTNSLNPKECWFTSGDVRIPEEGVIIIKG